MQGDITRSTFQPQKHYRNVRQQQGRVGLDADWNEQGDITAYRAETEARDVIGQCGAPKHHAGFAIKNIKNGDFDIGAGRFYVDGILCENEARVTFCNQPDLRPGALKATDRYLVYLDVWLRHISALDDPEIREVALGGPDTATRAKVVWQVRALKVAAKDTCHTKLQAWKDLTASSTAQLSARVAKEEPSDKPCILPPGAGYRRLENQLYRVEIHRGGKVNDSDLTKVATFKWSRDNGSVAARIESIVGDKITLTAARKDPVLGFAPGQWIEMIDDRSEWERQPGVLVPILKAEDRVLTVDTTRAIEPQTDAPTAFSTTPLDQSLHPKVRRWDSVEKASPIIEATIPGTNGGFLPLEDGVEVKFADGTCQPGDYWLIPARTDKGNVEWPQDSAKPAPQLPNGIVHHFCRLAIIDVDSAPKENPVDDCRRLFPPLTEIDDCCGCCTVTVGETDAADFRSIQAAIESLPDTGGQICVMAGNYPEKVKIFEKRDIIITGCGERSRLTARPHELGAQGAPVIEIEKSSNIRLEALSFTAALHSAIAVHQSKGITIRECEIQMTDPKGSEPAIFFHVQDGLIERNVIFGGEKPRLDTLAREVPADHGVSGIQLAGGSSLVRVVDNLIARVSWQGITLGSVEDSDEQGGDHKSGVERPPPSSNAPRRKRSAPLSLWQIYIAGNRVLSTGMDGIGVANFFDLSEADELITVRGLTILGNEIRSCLRVPPATIEPKMADSMGHGGIALADVSELVIHDNVIEGNGSSHTQPVCGIFVLHGEGIDISRNRIMANGGTAARMGSGTNGRSIGRRGGIQIVYALSPVAVSATAAEVNPTLRSRVAGVPEPTGFPALKVHDNIVSSPIGPALSVMALGPVSVLANQLTSGGLETRERSFVFAPATVFIFNLGVSNEAYFQALFAKLGQKPVPASRGLDDFRVGDRLANGNILFAHNQCSLDLLETGGSAVFTSLALASLDDIGFEDNQCDCNLELRQDFVVAHAYLFSPSLRVTGNRFKEGLFQAAYSAVTTGLLNVTTHNQATHCLLASGPFLHDTPNSVVIKALAPGYCGRNLRTTLTNLTAERKI